MCVRIWKDQDHLPPKWTQTLPNRGWKITFPKKMLFFRVYVNVGEHNSYSSATLSSCVGGSVCSSIQNPRIFFTLVPASASMCMPWRQPLEPDGIRPSQRVFKNMGRKAWHQSSPSANLLQCIFEPKQLSGSPHVSLDSYEIDLFFSPKTSQSNPLQLVTSPASACACWENAGELCLKAADGPWKWPIIIYVFSVKHPLTTQAQEKHVWRLWVHPPDSSSWSYTLLWFTSLSSAWLREVHMKGQT